MKFIPVELNNSFCDYSRTKGINIQNLMIDRLGIFLIQDISNNFYKLLPKSKFKNNNS